MAAGRPGATRAFAKTLPKFRRRTSPRDGKLERKVSWDPDTDFERAYRQRTIYGVDACILGSMSPGSKRNSGIAMAIILIAAVMTSFSRREAAHSPPATDMSRADKQDRATPVSAAFDFYLMAMTVHPAFCADNARRRECASGSPRPLVIHGLWPERMEPRTYPHDCPAPALDLEPALALELGDLMPGMADGLHQHEWREHGGCSGLDDDDYYRHTLELARRVAGALAATLTTRAGGEATAGELRGIAD